MVWWVWILAAVYVIGFGITVHFHFVIAPNATLGLFLLRCFLWPIFWATGWPHGLPLMMD